MSVQQGREILETEGELRLSGSQVIDSGEYPVHTQQRFLDADQLAIVELGLGTLESGIDP